MCVADTREGLEEEDDDDDVDHLWRNIFYCLLPAADIPGQLFFSGLLGCHL